MRCNKCGVKWITGNQTLILKECPICNNDLTSGLSAMEPETITELLYYMISEFGNEIVHDSKKVCAYIDDVFPSEHENRFMWKRLFENHLGDYLYEWINHNPSREDAKTIIEGLSEEKISADLYSEIFFLIGLDKVSGSRFDTSDYYLSVYKSFTDYKLQKLALGKAEAICRDDVRRNVLWKLIALEENHQDIDIEKHLHELVKMNDHDALLKLIHLYEVGGVIERDRTQAFQLLQEHETPLDKDLLYQLGRYYELGWAGTVDLKLSEDYFCRAAGQGSAKAQYQLYNLYVKNPANNGKAVQYLIDAAEQEYPPAIHQLAICTFYGNDVDRDVYKAISLLQENADKGYKASADKLEYFRLLL